ncbi:tetratricopeptide repeat protein [Candidatus Omnitrophota bacterium]
MTDKQDLDFEISFFEKILQERPDFVHALVALGEAYTRQGRYKDGLKVDKKLTKLRPDDPTVYYNLACSNSLLKMADASLAALKKAIGLGYREFDFMKKDPDLEFIRKDQRYTELLSKYKDNP